MTFDEMHKRYKTDPTFHHSVNYLYALLRQGILLTSELRDVAMFAGYKFESENVRPVFSKPFFANEATTDGKGKGSV
jgi:hypothetical protein